MGVIKLTKREKEVLRELANSLSGPAISSKLNIAQSTVNTHRRNLIEKFNASSTVDLIRLANETGVLDEYNKVIRLIEFSPKYFSSGLSILSYFKTIVQQKEPELKDKLRIETDGKRVSLSVYNADYDEQIKIERLLSEYEDVITGAIPVAEFLQDRQHIKQLENKVALAMIDLATFKGQLSLTEAFNKYLITTSETRNLNNREDIKWYQTQLQKSYETLDPVEIIRLVISKSDTAVVEQQLSRVSELILSENLENVKNEILEQLLEVKKRDSKAFEMLRSFITGTTGGVAGRFLYELIKYLTENPSAMV